MSWAAVVDGLLSMPRQSTPKRRGDTDNVQEPARVIVTAIMRENLRGPHDDSLSSSHRNVATAHDENRLRAAARIQFKLDSCDFMPISQFGLPLGIACTERQGSLSETDLSNGGLCLLFSNVDVRGQFPVSEPAAVTRRRSASSASRSLRPVFLLWNVCVAQRAASSSTPRASWFS